MFTSPSMMNTMAMTMVTMVPLRGSLAGPTPMVSRPLIFFPGKIWSPARACMVRGAISSDPIAELRVAAASPNGISQPWEAIWLMYSSSLASCSEVPFMPSLSTVSV